MKGIIVGLMITAVAGLLAASLTMAIGGSEPLNFLASLSGTILALVLDFGLFA